MANISIALSNVQNTKTVNIEELGVFTVRRLGPGEEYDLSVKKRRLIRIMEELNAIKYKMDNADSPTEMEQFADANLKKINKLSDEIVDIKGYELNLYKKCFIDDANGEKTDTLINTLTEDERTKLYGLIFDESRDSNEK